MRQRASAPETSFSCLSGLLFSAAESGEQQQSTMRVKNFMEDVIAGG
jgi:hypothetical protein